MSNSVEVTLGRFTMVTHKGRDYLSSDDNPANLYELPYLIHSVKATKDTPLIYCENGAPIRPAQVPEIVHQKRFRELDGERAPLKIRTHSIRLLVAANGDAVIRARVAPNTQQGTTAVKMLQANPPRAAFALRGVSYKTQLPDLKATVHSLVNIITWDLVATK